MAKLTKREKNAEKNRRLEEREQRREKLTNWYMINLCFGILAIVALFILRQFYFKPEALPYMQMVTWSLTGLFTLAAVIVFLLGASGKIKNRSRANNYTIFLGVCALGSLWLALYNKIRVVLENILRAITGNPNALVNSHWNIKLLIIGIVVYLVVAFIWYLVKLNKTK